MKTLTRNLRDHRRIGTHKHTETVLRYFDRHGHLFQLEENKSFWTHNKDFTLFWLKKTVVPVKISQYSFRVFVCVCPSVISSILVRVFTFLSLNLWFSYFGTFLSTWSTYIYIYTHTCRIIIIIIAIIIIIIIIIIIFI